MSKFVISPYFNSNEHVSKLFFLLKKSYPAFTGDEINEEDLFRKIFPESTFDIKRFRVVSSRLFAVLEKFLVVENGRDNSIEFQQKLTQEYGRRNLYKYFEKGIRKMDEELDKQSYQDAEYFRNKMLLNRWYYEHPATNRLSEGAREALGKRIDYTDTYFVLSKLELGLSAANQLLVSDKEYPFRMEESIKYESKTTFSEIPVVILFQNTLLLQKETDDILFNESKSLLFNQSDKLSQSDRLGIHTLLCNYCNKRILSGAEGFRKVKFDLREKALKRGWLVEPGKISATTFWGMAQEAILLGKFRWTEQFILNYEEYLSHKIKHELVGITKAYLEFHRSNYNDVVELLTGINNNIPYFKTMTRVLLMRTYYRLHLNNEKYEDLFFSQLDANEKFARRDSGLSSKQKHSFLQFILYMRRTARQKTDLAALEKLNKELKSSDNFDLKVQISAEVNNLIQQLTRQ